MPFVDKILNRVTMYRLVVYGLGLLAVAGIFLASIGQLHMPPVAMIASLIALLISCFATEVIFSRVWRAPYNAESWLITALIIFLIFPAPRKMSDIFITIAVGVISGASKYLIAWRGKHVFNPAAFAVAVSSIAGWQTSTWWVGNSTMWPLALVVGLLFVRKIRRFPLVLSFLAAAIAGGVAELIHHGMLSSVTVNGMLFASPLIFLGTVMLTEPATMPPKRHLQIIFAIIVAGLYAKGETIGPIPLYPEVALLIGNLLAFAVAPKFKLRLQLQEIEKISDQVYNYVFLPERKFAFDAGQYMEWTLPGVDYDNRGNRRTFTIASSPTKDSVEMGVKFYHPTSMYKYELSRMKPGDIIYASQLAGSFTLPRDENEKLAFVAGGIGITPFRSMITYLQDTDQKRDIMLLYVVSKPEELAYINELNKAEKVGVKTVPILTDMSRQEPGMLTAKLGLLLIERQIPDYADRTFYVSGPDAMVTSTRATLRELDVDRLRIKTDHFSGY